MNIVISDAGVNWRGSEEMTRVLAQGFQKHGHKVIIFCRPRSILYERLHTTITCEPLLSGGDLDPFTVVRCIRALKRHRADVVITQKDKDVRLSGLAARMARVPLVILHITDRPLKNKLRYRFYFGGRQSVHVAVSDAMKQTIRKSAPWLAADIHVIRNGINVDRFANAAPLDLQLQRDEIAVGFVGTFSPAKGMIEFAQAWQIAAPQLPLAHAFVAGAGGREAEFRAALQGAARVHFLGFQSDVAALMKALDIFVFPSWFEGFGLAMAEAMAAGTAVVAFNTSSLPELAVNGEEALLVGYRNVNEMSAAIVRLANDPQLRARLAAAAQARVRRDFTEEKMVERYLDLLSGIVASRARDNL